MIIRPICQLSCAKWQFIIHQESSMARVFDMNTTPNSRHMVTSRQVNVMRSKLKLLISGVWQHNAYSWAGSWVDWVSFDERGKCPRTLFVARKGERKAVKRNTLEIPMNSMWKWPFQPDVDMCTEPKNGYGSGSHGSGSGLQGIMDLTLNFTSRVNYLQIGLNYKLILS